jgi:fructosamine-3-kinase
LGTNGEKLSKQNGAKARSLGSDTAVCHAMQSAATALGLSQLSHQASIKQLNACLQKWSEEWSEREATKIGA